MAKAKAGKAGSAEQAPAQEQDAASRNAGGISPDPMINLVIADIALRGGSRLLRHVVEHSVLGSEYPSGDARRAGKSRNMAQALIGTAIARIAAGSVPGAIIVGGGLIARMLHDRRKSRAGAQAEGEPRVKRQARKD
ncbi:MAG: hypothetical protein LBV50_10020 [Novosphingobium sp.]|jgi:hypothetical protein|nr:hypothetical protein [Novosphingobium sp.]